MSEPLTAEDALDGYVPSGDHEECDRLYSNVVAEVERLQELLEAARDRPGLDVERLEEAFVAAGWGHVAAREDAVKIAAEYDRLAARPSGYPPADPGAQLDDASDWFGECGFNEPHEPHGYVIAKDGEPLDLECPGLAARPSGEVDVERLARADWEVFGGARASGSSWDDLDDATKERTLDYARKVDAEYAALAEAQQREGAGS